MKMIDNCLFDDGSLECYNYWLADREDVEQVSFETIKELKLVSRIKQANKLGKSHISVNFEYNGRLILEIQWG